MFSGAWTNGHHEETKSAFSMQKSYIFLENKFPRCSRLFKNYSYPLTH